MRGLHRGRPPRVRPSRPAVTWSAHEHDATGSGHATACELVQDFGGVEWKERSEHLAGRRDGPAVGLRVVENEDDPVDPTVATLQPDASSQRLGVRESRLQFDCRNCTTVIDGGVPCTLVPSIPDRYFRPDGQARPHAVPDQREEAQVARVAERIPTRKGPQGQVESDDGTDARARHDVQPRCKAALDAAELGGGKPGGCRHRPQGKSSGQPGVPDLDPNVDQQPLTPPGTSIRV